MIPKEHSTNSLSYPLRESELIQSRSSSIWISVWKRLLHNPEAVFGLIVILIFILVALAGPLLTPYQLSDTNIKNDHLPPFWVKRSVIGLAGRMDHPLGTDRHGRDLLAWAIYGTRTSMILGLVSAPIIAIFGMLVGLLSGYAGGWVDNLLMRITDVFHAFPQIMICILVILILRETVYSSLLSGVLLLFIAFLLFGWAGAARIVRSSVLAVKNLDYIEAAHCMGLPPLRIIFKHILPNSIGPLIIWTTLMVPQLILVEALLRYLNISPSPPLTQNEFFTASWGGMIMEGRSFIHVHPIVVIIPAVCIGLISIAFTFLGDALHDALDPQKVEKFRD